MTTRAAYAPDDWAVLRRLVPEVAEAMRIAGPSGPGGRFLEERAGRAAQERSLGRLASVELIADLQAAHASDGPPAFSADPRADGAAFLDATLADADRARVILAAVATPGEAEAYRSLVMDVGEGVATAAGEPGSSAKVSDGERALLGRLAAALGAEGYEPPHKVDSPFGDYRDTGAAERDLYGEDPTR